MAPDGGVWARIRDPENGVTEFDPRCPQWMRALIMTCLIAEAANARLHMSFVTSGYAPPEPLTPATEPYPGFGDVHSSYMNHQQEFIEWFKKEANKINRGIAASADM
ncbi:hypothetical protein GCM10022214_33790 [Actinomadura miaoliensis]|uniref:Uncharacterized protein n=2 Tax=Actinomadura miaoliensis TaxID=430685 RepID=A0ABP7VTL6_9ACTN